MTIQSVTVVTMVLDKMMGPQSSGHLSTYNQLPSTLRSHSCLLQTSQLVSLECQWGSQQRRLSVTGISHPNYAPFPRPSVFISCHPLAQDHALSLTCTTLLYNLPDPPSLPYAASMTHVTCEPSLTHTVPLVHPPQHLHHDSRSTHNDPPSAYFLILSHSLLDLCRNSCAPSLTSSIPLHALPHQQQSLPYLEAWALQLPARFLINLVVESQQELVLPNNSGIQLTMTIGNTGIAIPKQYKKSTTYTFCFRKCIVYYIFQFKSDMIIALQQQEVQ